MKVLIQNKYIDFSVVTHIEDNNFYLSLFVFRGEKIILRNNVAADKKESEALSMVIGRYTELPETDEDVKAEKEWQELKEKVIDIWNNTESAIKEIRCL